MKQCGRIIARINEFKEKHQNIPNKLELIEFMNKRGDDPETTIGWNFDQENEEYFARKNSISMDSGRTVDIIITKKSEFIISNHKPMSSDYTD